MPSVIVETDPAIEPPLSFSINSAPLVYFLSFAYAARYGAQHELTKASMLLRTGEHKIDLKPLLTFADRDIENEADRAELERVWQDAGPLAECCRAVVAAIDADASVRELVAEFPALRDLIDELGRIAAEAAERGATLRISYTMA
jgi:hypothetical protein